MNKQFKVFMLCLLTPGLGYFEMGDKKTFYKTIGLFFGILLTGAILRLFTNFFGFITVFILLTAIYFFSAAHATFKTNKAYRRTNKTGFLKLCFILTFLSITGLSFANRRTFMGFDIMSMDVPVMEPTLLRGDRFLVDTWTNKEGLLKRGAVIIHTFNGQQGLYLNRIIAVGGDEIEIKNGVVYLNGKAVAEPYILTAKVTRPQSKYMQALTIPKDHYFVMGDNRDASFGDSRFSGTITMDNIVGKATDIISSQDKSKVGSTIK